MTNRYEVPEVIEIGTAADLILGSTKGLLYDDGPGQPKRYEETGEDE